MRRLVGRAFAAGLVVASSATSPAGMPSPLPTDFAVNDLGEVRQKAIRVQ